MHLLNKLRNRVNESDFVCSIYSNYNGKNLWNCICSAMDWIEVGITKVHDKYIFLDNNLIDCMNFYKYVSAIDVVCEGIYQLHRIFMGKESLPFTDDKSIFNNNILNTQNDDEFFKELRACFGAHPVNLKNRKNKNEKRFASWSIIGNSSFSKYNCNVILYSNIPEEDDIYLGVNIRQIKRESVYTLVERINTLKN